MSWLQLTLTILTVMALSAGQVLFKLASEDLKLSVSGLLPSLLSTKLILALFIYGVATVMWLVVLKIAPLRIAYPFIAMAFIFVPILAHFILGEQLHWNTFAGALLIVAGVWVSVIR
jgi:drug/metabolite transporter (DMT)-like permease